MKNKVTDPIDYIYNFTKSNIQGPRNLSDTMIKSSDGTFEEVLKRTGGPIYEYQVGVLWPHRVFKKEEEQEEDSFNKGDGDDDSDIEEESILNQKIKNKIESRGAAINDEDTINSEEENLISLAYQRHQCAMGLSFRPKPNSDFEVNIYAAQYFEDAINEELAERESFKGLSIKKKKVWYRKSIGDRKIKLKNNELPKQPGDQIRRHVLGDDSNPQLVFVVRKLSNTIFTAYLFNEQNGMEDTNKSSKCFFQVEFSIESSKGFLPYTKSNPLNVKEGIANNFDLLYSDFPTFAIGHGCSPEWDMEQEISEIRAVHFPRAEVKPVKAKPLFIKGDQIDLSMEFFSKEEHKEESINILEKFIEEYSKWINSKVKETSNLEPLFKSRADSNLQDCKQSATRMQNGINALKEHDDTFKAFCLMNEAMLLQQIRHNAESWVITKDSDKKIIPTIEDKSSWPDWNKKLNKNMYLGNWRPFQLAFILMNLTSISSNIDSEQAIKERKIVDLIWFPTGGGKTEAYFGLTAFNIFSRRLKNKDDDGTAVITRYTYRVLTTQQFERSAALIASCDLIRQKNVDILGEKCIDLGLWIGNTASHRDQEEAKLEYKEISRFKMRNVEESYTKPHKFTLQSCPTCKVSFFDNKKINTLGIKKISRQGPVRIEYQCPNSLCDYHNKKIPVSAIDEDLYNNPPTFLIGTVDKFALLPFRRRARSFFGFDSDNCPPDLIIQDELHLISGPLGSIYGIYEKLINELILKANDEIDNFFPKIVCSTATVNSANDQIEKLYGKTDSNEINIFPSNAIKIWDNFFSEIDFKEKGRTYIGVMPQVNVDSVTNKRYYLSSLLQAGKNLERLLESNEYTYDAYWTVVDYYTSLKDLGVGYSTATSDVFDQLNGFKINYKYKDNESRKLRPDRIVELTGRDPSQSIPERLKQLSIRNDLDKENSIDICLTTNMFSVGVDIPRLGLMFLNNQTKTSSEYIQATSRVGRSSKGPGLVAVQYASSRPRDRSFFEQFQSYHTRFYSHVEPTSVTPYSFRVIDKALPAIIIGFLRLVKNYSNDETEILNQNDFEECKLFVQKFSSLCSNESEKEYIMDKCESIISKIDANTGNYHQFYPPSFKFEESYEHMIYPEGVELKSRNTFNAPTSMRNVDSESKADILTINYKDILDKNYD